MIASKFIVSILIFLNSFGGRIDCLILKSVFNMLLHLLMDKIFFYQVQYILWIISTTGGR